MAHSLRHLIIPLVFIGLSNPDAHSLARASVPAPWTVKVTTPDAAPVPQATVFLLGLRGQPIHATEVTDETGEAKVRPPAQGSYLIRVEKPGFKRKEMPLMASPEEPPLVLIKLERAA